MSHIIDFLILCIAGIIGGLTGRLIAEGARRVWKRMHLDPQTRQAQRIARQATRDFKRRQRLRSVRFWNF